MPNTGSKLPCGPCAGRCKRNLHQNIVCQSAACPVLGVHQVYEPNCATTADDVDDTFLSTGGFLFSVEERNAFDFGVLQMPELCALGTALGIAIPFDDQTWPLPRPRDEEYREEVSSYSTRNATKKQRTAKCRPDESVVLQHGRLGSLRWAFTRVWSCTIAKLNEQRS